MKTIDLKTFGGVPSGNPSPDMEPRRIGAITGNVPGAPDGSAIAAFIRVANRCERCKGSGETMVSDGDGYEDAVSCSACGGSGFINPADLVSDDFPGKPEEKEPTR